MNHRALALKYRPQRFSDLVGQDQVAAVLERAVERNRVAHAYLFTGSRGVGKTTTARILAKALNCERRGSGAQAGPEPCNECTSCLEITSGVSLDVAEIDGASNRGIADVQALREKVRFTPTGGRYRVVIIDEVHQLSNDAFAALLKTLEEPPPHLVFVFATTDPQKLPDTIRSRTQRFDFARVPLRKLAARVTEIARREAEDPAGVTFTLSEGAALLIAQKAEGSVRDAVSALDQVVSAGEAEVSEELVRRVLGIADREAFFGVAAAILARDPKATLAKLHEAFEKGLDATDLAEGLSEHIRHLLILRVDPGAAELVPATAEEIARMREQAHGWPEADLLRLLRLISESVWPMRDSPQPLILLEAAVLQMASLEPGETLAELLERLEALEQRLEGSTSGPAAGPPSTRVASPAPSAATRSAGAGGAGASPPSASASGPRAPAEEMRAAPARASADVATSRPTPMRLHASEVAAERSPAPAGGTASAAATATLDAIDPELLTGWSQVIAAINEKKRMLGAFLQECQFLGLGPHAILLGMDDLHRSVVDERDNRAMVAHEAARVFGRRLAIQYAPLGTPPRPKARDLDPLIDRTIAWFEGEPVERSSQNPEINP
ncbi:MAG: DNA polymerase III subunit gamma/tau [Candidatus Eisenbacteria bacterium]|uniref:DNA polymerase III subunit gamma/tau n=1 Tax=Eiseniibacteriota bacterium TaxID=2212470 RepID=A0A538TFN3_UNCEI|nr:MAG: DNA polymerase III subunit gamma/tau [Candidatus Eisenbacteria bacterium]